jgi:hypothetical protein
MQRPIGTFRIPDTAGLVAGLVGLVGLVAALGGCLANGGDGSILVVKAVAPPMTATSGVCTFTSSDAEAGLAHGALDVTLGSPYVIVAQVKSRIIADPGQEDARTIFLRGANVDLTFSDATLASQIGEANLHFMSPIFVSLPPNGGLQDVPLVLIPAAAAKALKGTPQIAQTVAVQATFTVVGDLAGSNESSQAFHYSVTLGVGNLDIDKGPCSTLSKSFIPRPGNPCYPGQDFVIDCCEGPTTALVCPAMGTGM